MRVHLHSCQRAVEEFARPQSVEVAVIPRRLVLSTARARELTRLGRTLVIEAPKKFFRRLGRYSELLARVLRRPTPSLPNRDGAR